MSVLNIRLRVELPPGWVLEHKNDSVLPMEVFTEILSRHLGISPKNIGLTFCVFTFDVDEDKKDELRKTVISILSEKMMMEQELLDNVKIDLEDTALGSEFAPKKKSERARQVIEDKTDSASVNEDDDLPENIRRLVGVPAFKALIREITEVAPQLHKHKAKESFTFQNYLFTIGDGCGLTTYLKSLADVIDDLNLFNFSSSSWKVQEHYVKNTPDGLEKAAEAHHDSSTSRIICYDISEWMKEIKTPVFRTFLRHLIESQNDRIFVFRIPYVDMAVLSDIYNALSDVLFVRSVSFPPFSMEELKSFGQTQLKNHGFEVTQGAMRVLEQRIINEKSDGRFYNLKTIQKLVKEMIYKKLLYNARHQLDNRRIESADIEDIAPRTINTATASGLDQLDGLIGMDPIKKRIEEILIQMQLGETITGLDKPCLHMRFVGNPGTGKTTVARLLGKILKENGILENGGFYEYSGRDFCGRYIGETAPKTAGICRDAYGSILFIDEAYSLYRSNNDSNDYGREALDTLIAEMENNRTNFVVIMAGYPDEMNKLMEGNVGLAGRMPYVLEFPNYNRDELADIFMSMLKGKFNCSAGFRKAVKDYFAKLPDDLFSSKEFSNARFVRNLFERTWGKAALRCQMEDIKPVNFIKSDFDKAATEREFSDLQGSKRPTIGFTIDQNNF